MVVIRGRKDETRGHSPGPGLKRMIGTCVMDEGLEMTAEAGAGLMVMVGCPGLPRPMTLRESLLPVSE